MLRGPVFYNVSGPPTYVGAIPNSFEMQAAAADGTRREGGKVTRS